MLISLVICTYNRADILRATLPSVLTLVIPEGDQLELIMVDNNSKDDTASFIKEFIGNNSTSIEISYVFEGKQYDGLCVGSYC